MTLAVLAAVGLWAGYRAATGQPPLPGFQASPDAPPAGPSEPQTQAVLYFCKNRGTASITEGVVRAIPAADRREPLAFAVRQLLQGPNREESQSGYYSEIPASTRLLSLQRTAQGWRVNLSRAFTVGGGSNSMTLRMKALQQTILAVEKRVPVFVDIEGQQLNVLGGEGLVVPEPLSGERIEP